MNQEDGSASVPDQALVNGAASVSTLTGFDPSRSPTHMRNGRRSERNETWCGKKLLGVAECDGEGIETFSSYGSDVRATYDEPFVTCQRCLDAFETSYRKAFPDGPKPIATVALGNPRAKELLGAETMTRFFGPFGEGAEAYERFVAAIEIETEGQDGEARLGAEHESAAIAQGIEP